MTTLLLQLDSNEADPELTAALFREAHTVKGGAAMVSLESVARLAHAMEDVLSQLRDGLRRATPELVDALLAVVEALSSIVPVAVDGGEHEAAVVAAERALAEAVGGGPEESRPAPEEEAKTAEPPEPEPARGEPAAAEPAPEDSSAAEPAPEDSAAAEPTLRELVRAPQPRSSAEERLA